MKRFATLRATARLRRNEQSAVRILAMTVAVIILAAPLRADFRGTNGAQPDASRGHSVARRGADNDRVARENERVTVEGRITMLDQDQDGWRVRLNHGGHLFWIPEPLLREHRTDVRLGASVRLGGILRNGTVRVDRVAPVAQREEQRFDDRRDREPRRMSAVVERVDVRRGLLVVRDDATRHIITVDVMASDDRRSNIGLGDIHRGDRIELTGYRLRNGTFRTFRIDRSRHDRR